MASQIVTIAPLQRDEIRFPGATVKIQNAPSKQAAVDRAFKLHREHFGIAPNIHLDARVEPLVHKVGDTL